MSRKQNKRHAEQKRTKKAIELERELLNTQFPMECETLPLAELDEYEQKIVKKCINKEYLENQEFKDLKALLQRYRKPMAEMKPQKTIENAENVIKIIKSEKELLDILDSPDRKYLLVHVPIDDQIYEMEFEVLPLEDSRAIASIQLQLDLFNDYQPKEIEIYSKYTNDKNSITREEKIIAERINKEIIAKANDRQSEEIVTLLSHQLRLPNSSQEIKDREEFWRKFPFNAKVSIFMQVQKRLGLTEQNNKDLFPLNK